MAAKLYFDEVLQVLIPQTQWWVPQRAILAKETASFQDTPVLVAGPWARRDPITLNPSYFSPATFAAPTCVARTSTSSSANVP